MIMPVLVYALGFSTTEAVTYSLGMVGITSLFAASSSLSENISQIRSIVLPFGIASISATLCTRLLILPLLPMTFSIGNQTYTLDSLFMILLACLMIYASKRMLFDSLQDASHSSSILALLLSGIFLGLLTGCTGIGGGFLIVPIMLVFGGLSMQQATNSSMILIACNTLPAFGFDVVMMHNAIQFDIFLLLVICSIGGSIVGVRIARTTRPDIVKKLFGILIGLVALFILLTELA